LLRPDRTSKYSEELLSEEKFKSENEFYTHDPEKQESEASISHKRGKVGFARRLWRKFRRDYWPKEHPALVLPSPPTNKEKLLYLHTNRIPLYIIGVFAFLSLSAGMWLFVICANTFYWYGSFAAFVQVYLLVSYFVGVIGKDFDMRPHEEALKNYGVDGKDAPSVDILLPCCFEPLELLENTYKYVKKLEYGGLLKVHVLDDGAQDSVRSLAAKYGFNYIVRDDRPRLRKAGNLRWAFTRTNGDFFVILDADFCPRTDFLQELIPEHLADDKTAIVQTPQYFRVTKEQTWVEQGAGATQELFYRVVQVNRNRWGASICVGSNAVYRRAALEEVGGTAEIGFSEDVHTGFGAVNRGWKVKYLPLCLACGACPDNPRSFFTQQRRWCTGSTTLLLNPEFWRSNLSFMQKICYSCGKRPITVFPKSLGDLPA
jgi:cellulose synthase/poly-beta-1,6-N-acetylglucosamine synthase-like glycosyltransferase